MYYKQNLMITIIRKSKARSFTGTGDRYSQLARLLNHDREPSNIISQEINQTTREILSW